MPHDHPRHHHHHHHDHHHGPGHNHDSAAAEHLHSHPIAGNSRLAEEARTLAASFIDGFRQAADKTSYLRVAGVPFQRTGADGLTLNLVDAEIRSNWQIGSASPGFAARELVYMPYPGEMVRARENMVFTYVSLTERADIDLLDILTDRLEAES